MEQFKLALRQTESDNNPRAFGDGGLALTSYQAHPAWVFDQLARLAISRPTWKPKIGDSWDQFVGSLVGFFFDDYEPFETFVGIAMHFHKGHRVELGSKDWDQGYADRFSMFANRLA